MGMHLDTGPTGWRAEFFRLAGAVRNPDGFVDEDAYEALLRVHDGRDMPTPDRAARQEGAYA